jgi:hypothetical protein
MGGMTEASTGRSGHDWQSALRDRVERAAARRELRVGARRAVTRRRDHGLIDRQAARLARARVRRLPAPTRRLPAPTRRLPAPTRRLPAPIRG